MTVSPGHLETTSAMISFTNSLPLSYWSNLVIWLRNLMIDKLCNTIYRSTNCTEHMYCYTPFSATVDRYRQGRPKKYLQSVVLTNQLMLIPMIKTKKINVLACTCLRMQMQLHGSSTIFSTWCFNTVNKISCSHEGFVSKCPGQRSRFLLKYVGGR